MKKNLSFTVILFIGLLAFISSCTKDKFSEQDAYNAQKDLENLQDSLTKSQILLRDSLKNVGGVINYSVGVILASDANWISNLGGSKGTQQLDQVIVTISQYGKRDVDTTDASGIASFKDLRIGTVNVNVRKAGYTEIDFIAVLPALPDSSHVAAYGVVRNVGTMVPVFSLTDNLSTIAGIATVETDLTNNAPEVAANVDIMATIDVDSYHFKDTYLQYKAPDLSNHAGTFDYYGIIKQIAFHSVISKTTTAADGSFSVQVPSTPDGLPIKMYASDFVATQKLLQSTLNNLPVWGVQSVRTLYGPPVTYTYSSIPIIGTAPNEVQSAYVQFSAPTGSPAAQPTTEATATAVLSSSGIASVNITSPGEGYTQPPLVTFGLGTAFNSVQAEGTAVISNGKVTGVTITSPGSGYKPSDNPGVTFTDGVVQQARYDAEFTFSVVDINGISWGSGYSQTPPAVTILGSGTGATAHAVMSAYLKTVTVTAPGSGYTQPPQITISDNFNAWDEAIPLMTTNNPLFSINYNGNNASTLWPVSPLPTATIVGDGSGATASVTLSTVGRVTGFSALVGGSGYTSAPTVIISGGGGFGATAHTTIFAGAVDNIIIDDEGQGYTSIPTFAFSGGAGSGASATPLLGFPVKTIAMTASGAGYNSVSAINVNNGGPNIDYLPYCVVAYNMGLRDINNFSPNGWYYSGVPTITITPKDGNGSGATAVGAIQWEINDIVVDNKGSGYKFDNENNVAVKIDAPAGTGVQATASAVLGNGKLSAVGAVWLGEGYTAAPNVLVANSEGVAPIKQAKLTATVSGGHVTGLTITDPGEGYDFNSYVGNSYYIDISTFNNAAVATAQANPKSGQIDYIQIDNPGAGYAVVPTVEIVNTSSTADANQFGTGALATAVLTDGRVTGITVNNPGSGYYVAPTIKIMVPSALVQAVGMCNVDVDGRITGVIFPSWASYAPYASYTMGYGYNTVPAVTFFPSVPGKGTGATGVAVINNGQVVDVVMTNQGSGYTGKNNPSETTELTITPDNNVPVVTFAGKTYIRDIYFGTGKRSPEEAYPFWYFDKK
jgi:hypothetical protein